MVYVWGSRLYGKVDNVKGVFHVATKFGHFDYIPIIPMGSWLIFEQTSEGWRGVPIPFSFKSVLIAWLRAAAILIGIISAIGAVGGFVKWSQAEPEPAKRLPSGRVIPERRESPVPWLICTGMLGVSAFVVFGSRYVPGIGKCTRGRARELAKLAGLEEEAVEAMMASSAPVAMSEQSGLVRPWNEFDK